MTLSAKQVELVKLMLKTDRNMIGMSNDRVDEDVQDLLDTMSATEFVDVEFVTRALRDIAGIETAWDREVKALIGLRQAELDELLGGRIVEMIHPLMGPNHSGPDVLDDLVDDVDLQQELLAFALDAVDDRRWGRPSGATNEAPPD